DLENPDVDESGLEEVADPSAPRSLINAGGKEVWAVTLEEAVSIALANSKVFRQLGGRIIPGNSGAAPEILVRNPQAIGSVYDPAVVEYRVEDALAAFDPQLGVGTVWQKNSTPINPRESFFAARTSEQDLGNFQTSLQKQTAGGGRLGLSNQTQYDQSSSRSGIDPLVASDWRTIFDASWQQPLLRGAGVSFNRIAGPQDQRLAVEQGGSQRFLFNEPQFNGVTIARINTDIRLADFEAGVRNLVFDIESAYWNLYFAYRNLDATRAGRNSALQTWKKIDALRNAGSKGGEQENWAQAKEQYYLFRGQMESALTEVYRAESRVRYIMGLAATDERLIKPADEPTTARVSFEWCESHSEALARSVELRQQRWRIQERELELSASKNLLLPGLDAVARYRWEGLGDDLISSNRSGAGLAGEGSNAFESLTSGDFQSWLIGLQFSTTLGNRRELAKVRQQQLLLARERALLQDQELEVSHQIADAIRDMQGFYVVAQTAFNRRVAAKQQVEAVEAAYEAGTALLDLLLDAQRRLADADIEYYRSLTNYNLSIATVHLRKNSLLDYNAINLAEGPWPCKAYFDAHRLARQRDASTYINYGMTSPRVFSRGPTLQHDGGETTLEGMPTPASEMEASPGEPDELPPPMPSTARARSAETNARGATAGLSSSARWHGQETVPQPGTAKRPERVAGGAPKTGSVRGEKFDWGNIVSEEGKSPARPTRQTSY
ncbi:MAG: TolC family protein, partial [Pirellulales bacterium]